MSDRVAGWARAPLDVLTSQVGSGSTPKGGEAAYKAQGIPLVRSMNVVFFGFKRQGLAFIDEAQAAAIGGGVVQSGDVLLNITGASIGRVTRAPADMAGARVNQHVCIVRPLPPIDARFLQAFLSSPDMQQQIHADNYGVTRQALTKQQILGFQVPIPPEAEQRRIADKLDTVLARVDAVNDRLARVAPLLKRFRQSVLAAAVNGQLIDREGHWPSATLGSLVEASGTGLVRAAAEQSTVADGLTPYLKMDGIHEHWGHASEVRVGVRCSAEEFERYELQAGDWLFNTRNSLELVGKSCVWSGPAGVVFNNNILRVRFTQHVRPHWVEIFFRSPNGRAALASVKSATTSVAAIYQRALMGLELPVPDLEAQDQLIACVESLFTYADRLEARLQAAQTAAERLTPALLAKAFRGELVPQDPNDEPASELLKRLAAARDTSASPRRGRGRRAGADIG